MNQSVLKLEKHEIFDLVEALYTFAILHHGGISSDLYSLQCEIGQIYKAGHGFSESDIEENNQYYPEITEDNARQIWDKVNYVLENRWEDM